MRSIRHYQPCGATSGGGVLYFHTFFCLATKESIAKKNAFFIAMDISIPRRAHNGLPRLP